MPDYPFKLDPSSKKKTCPGCGKRTFVPYIYNETGEPVDSQKYGRCDRENNCGYHEHPSADPNDPTLGSSKSESYQPAPKPDIIQIYPEEAIIKPLVSRTRKCTSPLHVYLKQKGYTMEHLIKWGVYTDGAHEEKTAYVFRNIKDQVCNIKWFAYLPDGHRNKKVHSYSLKQPSPPPPHTHPSKKNQKFETGKIPPIRKYFMCLFGEHLLDPKKKRTVCVVESEKSAMMAAFHYPQYDWVSCGSASGLSDGSNGTADKITPLMNRKIYWLSDADKAGRSNSSIRNLAKYKMDFLQVDLAPEHSDGRDIGDLVDMGVRPDIEEAAKTAKIRTADINLDNIKDEDIEKHLYDLPKGAAWKDVKRDIMTYGQFEHNNQMYIIKQISQNNVVSYGARKISNFGVKPLGLIDSKHDPRRLIEITNIHRKTKVLEVPTKAFASNIEFTIFIESEGNYQWNGQTQDLKKIRSKLYDKMSSFKEVDTLGWHDGLFIFANGIWNGKFAKIDKYGFCHIDKESFFIPPLSIINQNNDEDWEDEKKFVYVKRDVKLKDWADLFCKVHKENGVISLAWFISSLFRDFIYRRYKFFPHLFLFGPPGTGKSQVGWSIRTMGFNGIKKPFNLSGGTKVSFHREFSHFVNFPAWFDEYDNSIDYDRVQSIKAAYDGSGHKKSVKDSDKRTKTVPVNSGCMISGQQLPIADNALFKRVILCQFYQTEFSDKEKAMFKQLQDMEAGGLSYITAGFMTFRDMIEKKYVDTFEDVLLDFTRELEGTAFEMEDRIVRNMCIVGTTLKVLWPKIGKVLPFTYENFKAVALRNIKDQMGLILNANEVNTFWDMVSYLIDMGLIEEEKDFKFRAETEVTVYYNNETTVRKLDSTKWVLFVRSSRIIPLYREHFKRQNAGSASPMDKGSLVHYLQHSKSYLGLVKGTRFENGNSSAYAFDYNILESQMVNLRRGFKAEKQKDAADPAGRQVSIGEDREDLPF